MSKTLVFGTDLFGSSTDLVAGDALKPFAENVDSDTSLIGTFLDFAARKGLQEF